MPDYASPGVHGNGEHLIVDLDDPRISRALFRETLEKDADLIRETLGKARIGGHDMLDYLAVVLDRSVFVMRTKYGIHQAGLGVLRDILTPAVDQCLALVKRLTKCDVSGVVSAVVDRALEAVAGSQVDYADCVCERCKFPGVTLG